MNNEEVKKIVGDTPCMVPHQADRITSFIEENALYDVLELGFAHGVSTSYMAAALGRLGQGSITAIDTYMAKDRNPRIEYLLEQVGELDRVNIFYEPTSYTWRLMKFLEEDPQPRFDLCYLDGAHNWFVDGFAFFLVDRLLRPGAWIIFDDLNWTYDRSPSLKNTEGVKQMPEDERSTPQIKKVYELLVKTHPDYHNFSVEGSWAFAQKRHQTAGSNVEREVVTEKIIERQYYGMGEFMRKAAKKYLVKYSK